ncbi:tRNA wybutosine-synthesizing protein 5 isoform X5 [Xenopus laevis]|uniref:tRNA wybutosine-synthesizing protein 5 isoform X5 n=1 Tax=Xenopus laevis TaxID=8355 RepID=A0A8J1LUK9_XENLA|nr:tRNA wybutosine-synthesizing protein 5 isoform X5 [Xenopus laevis]
MPKGIMEIKQQKISLPEYTNVDRQTFLQDIYPLLVDFQRKPVVLKGLHLGDCSTKWTVDYMSKTGGSKEVKIHVSEVPQMDFIRKNFLYRTLPFDTFVKRAAKEKHTEFFISENEKYYLRSLGEDPRKVMDNLLIQVTGKKRVVLYSPRDAPYLYLSGDKSEVLDVDNPDLVKYPLFSHARRYECYLEAGDVLFIPALWFHNTVADGFGVGVNVFWKDLPSECYDKTDTYGNKDPCAASRAMQILDRALKTLEELPEEYKDFYARRMVLRIQAKAYSANYE